MVGQTTATVVEAGPLNILGDRVMVSLSRLNDRRTVASIEVEGINEFGGSRSFQVAAGDVFGFSRCGLDIVMLIDRVGWSDQLGGPDTVVFHPNFLGLVMILLIAVFTVGLLAVKQM